VPIECGPWGGRSGHARLRGLRLLATDIDWSAGARGRTAGTDRDAAAIDSTPQLSGPGVRTVTERFVIPRAEADQS
jgi:hypothetical protein